MSVSDLVLQDAHDDYGYDDDNNYIDFQEFVREAIMRVSLLLFGKFGGGGRGESVFSSFPQKSLKLEHTRSQSQPIHPILIPGLNQILYKQSLVSQAHNLWISCS